MNNVLEVNNLSKSYNTLSGEIKAIDNINFNVKKGEIIAIVGNSGCGKSTLLSILSGLEKETTGTYKFDRNTNIGYMLQQDALLPWLSIYDNVLLGLKINNKLYNKSYIDYLLKKYDLYDFKEKKPKELSGGMKQRVALIRTLALKPNFLLLDEPFSALDYQTRLLISKDVYNTIKENNMTMILVTHDIGEAISLADKVIILSKRPCHIKSIIPIDIDHSVGPIEVRLNPLFNKYYDIVWKQLDAII